MRWALKLTAVPLALYLATAPAQAFLWPWQHHRHHYSHGRHRQVIVPPDCEQINKDVKELDPNRVAGALRSLTKKQREIIAQCSQQ